mmetsp:Transcript_1660/g.4909  ORF Transcript_1660/g.4909 Transcript_1660/m.4909 type:complete len:323 (+) Transcript_1660:57-1025(+)
MTSSAGGAAVGDRQLPKILVTGASGLLGRQVMSELPGDSYEVRGIVHSRARPRCVQCDLTVAGEIARQIQDFRPDAVINLVAERRPDVVHRDPASASKKNVGLVKALADACREADAWLLHFSTDYVFDGTKPPYYELDTPNPLSAYGEQKLESEKVVMACAPEHGAILRIPLLFGPMEFCKESAVTSLYEDAVSGVMTKADHSQRRYPTCTEDLAKVVRRLVDINLSGQKPLGFYHWQGDECLTKYDMVQAIGEVMELDVSGVQPDKVVPAAPRPEDSRLDCSRLEELLGGAEAAGPLRTPFRDSLRRAFEALKAHEASKEA